MHREYLRAFSPALGREMELLVFGHAGARVVAFPTSMGRFFDWENRGLVEAVRDHLDGGGAQLTCVDSVDAESWYDQHKHPADRARRHQQYDDYLTREVL